MRYRYHTVDVFTEQRFGGNPLAVLPEATGLSHAQMQSVAAEFNYSETTFVLPPADSRNTRHVRIFTPRRELPFAGHPNVGTAFVLAACGAVDLDGAATTVRFEEDAGVVPVRIDSADGAPRFCELEAPGGLTLGDALEPAAVAEALGLRPDEIATAAHPPILATVGITFLVVELVSAAALARAAARSERLAALPLGAGGTGVHLYTRDGGGEPVDLRARMFAPLGGIPEDPATGSANCVLAGLLAHLDARAAGRFAYHIAQGIEMGRPSALHARVEKRHGAVARIHIGGACVLVAEGEIAVG